MTAHSPTTEGRWLLALKLIGIILVWLYLLAVFHHLLHENAEFISTVLNHPAQKALAAFLALSVFIYLIIWSLPHVHRPSWSGFITISIWSLLIVLGHGVTHTGESSAHQLLEELRQMMGVLGFVLLAFCYALFLAMPFVAGVEIGLLIMAIFGAPGVLVAYCGTVIGLNLAFGLGRMLTDATITKLLSKLHIKSEGLSFDNVVESLASGSGWVSRLGRRLLDNRYLALAFGLNFPGNSLIGGGGGLSLIAGISKRLVSWPYFALVTLVATLPVPLLVLLGMLNIERSVEHSGWFHTLLDNLYSILPLF